MGTGNKDDVQNLGQDLAAKVSLNPEKEDTHNIPNITNKMDTYNTATTFKTCRTPDATPTTNTSRTAPTFASTETCNYAKIMNSQKQVSTDQVAIWQELQNFVEKESILQSATNNNNLESVSKPVDMASPCEAVRSPVTEPSGGGMRSPQAMMIERRQEENQQDVTQHNVDPKNQHKMETNTNKDINESTYRF